MRKPHFLTANRMAELPTRMVFVDTETSQVNLSETVQENVLWFGWACYVRRTRKDKYSQPEYFKFESVNDFWVWVEGKSKEKTKLYIYAHNWSFDALVLKAFSSLSGRGYRMTGCILEEPPIVFEYRRSKATVILVDTLNYFRVPLAILGSNMGIRKLSKPEENASSESWDEYCKTDVSILVSSMVDYFKFISSNNFGNYQLTTPAQAFNAYRHRFMKHKILIDSNEKALKIAREGYFGGRTECYFVGKEKGKFYVLDVNSEYPFVMSYAYLPSELVSVYSRVSIDKVRDLLPEYVLIADVTVNTDEPVYPLRNMKRLVFPVGNFRTILPHAELLHALRSNHLQRIHSVAVYKKARLFQDYVLELYELRRKFESEGNQAFAYICKLMLNSLYGKFGQSGRVYTTVGESELDKVEVINQVNAQTHEVVTLRTFAGIIQELRREAESMNSHPAISACITSEARLYLWSLITQADISNVYYVDTDSLVVNQAGFEALKSNIDEGKLGYLKKELEFTELEIHTLKDYRFGKRVKIKGIRKNAVQIATDAYLQDTFRGIRGMIRDGDFEQQIVKKVIKHLRRNYVKGAITESGRVIPLEFYLDCNGENMLKVSSIPLEARVHFSKRYQPKIISSRDIIDPYSQSVDPGAVRAERLQKRRDGEEIYQRGRRTHEKVNSARNAL